MGTNYYLFRPATCRYCLLPHEEAQLHIGKSSGGWVFSLHLTPEQPSLAAWYAEIGEALSAGGRIEDEYGRPVTLEKLRAEIEQRQPWGGLDLSKHNTQHYNHTRIAPCSLLYTAGYHGYDDPEGMNTYQGVWHEFS